MARGRLLRSLLAPALVLSFCAVASVMQGQGAKQSVPQNPIPDSDADHINERNQWFFRGRLVHGKLPRIFDGGLFKAKCRCARGVPPSPQPFHQTDTRRCLTHLR